MTLDTSKAREIVAWVDAHAGEIVAFLSELIRIPSVFPPGEYDALARRMEAAYDAAGVDVRLITAPRGDIEARGLTYPRPNVVAQMRGSGGGPVLLIATHMDVVDPAERDAWTHDPFGGVVEDGRIWGRGACDAKCAMAAQVFTARALAETGTPLAGTLLLISSVDDEGRFDRLKWPGMTYLAERGLADHGLPSPDMVINGEASGLGDICAAFKGRLILEIPVVGETAHAATPHGVNAIDKALTFIEALRGIELRSHALLGDETMNVCSIRGVADRYGDIPPVCHVGLEIRVVPPDGTSRMRAEIDRVIRDLSARDPQFRVGEFTVFSDRQPVEFPETTPLVVAIREAAQAIGVDARYAGILGTGELQAFVGRGIPGVTYGPGHIARVHKPNEFLEVDQLLDQVRIYALTALTLCGAPEPAS